MRNFIIYIISLLVLIILHEYVLLNISATGYMNFYVYILGILILPMQQRTEITMLIAVMVGAIMDIIGGTSALCTMSLVCVAFFRKGVLKLVVPGDILVVGGIPFSFRIGVAPFLRYVSILSVVYGAVYFGMEVMSLEYIGGILLRLAYSVVVNVVLIFVFQLPFRGSLKS